MEDKLNMKKENTIKEMFDKWLNKDGIEMSKKISSGGLFTSPTYDNRTVYNREDVQKLMKEGFLIDTNLDLWVFNMIWTQTE